MKLHFNVTGERRKALVQAIGEITGKSNLHGNTCHIATRYMLHTCKQLGIYSFFLPVNSAINLSQNVSFTESTSTTFVSSGFSIPSHFNTN